MAGRIKPLHHISSVAVFNEVGIEATLFEAEPGRTNVLAHWGGPARQDGGLLLHGHLDVVRQAVRSQPELSCWTSRTFPLAAS